MTDSLPTTSDTNTGSISGAATDHPFGINPELEDRIAASIASSAVTRRRRHDGWTGERQRVFLEAIAAGDPIEWACRRVNMSVASAYAFRSSENGVAFRLAWEAAQDMVRHSMGDFLWRRVMEGVEIETQGMDGKLTIRRQFDNHLGMRLLNRQDRLAELARKRGDDPLQQRLALVERHWDAFLSVLEAAQADDRAGNAAAVDSFVSEHATPAETEADAPADLPQLPQLCAADPLNPALADRLDALGEMVEQRFSVSDDGALSTTAAPPADFAGEEVGVWPEPGYARSCTLAETAIYDQWVEAYDAHIAACNGAERATSVARDQAWLSELTAVANALSVAVSAEQPAV
jgi:hypothetical protein